MFGCFERIIDNSSIVSR